MSIIEQQIAVTYGHLVRLTKDIFSRASLTLRHMLAVQVNSRGHRALTVMDEILFHAQTALLNQVQAYFKRHGKHEMNPLINVNSISELCDCQTRREQSVISVRA